MGDDKKLVQGARRAWIFLLLTIAFFIRLIPFYLHPSLFAEEGSVFFPRIVHSEWDPSHTGYLQVFAYAWMWISCHISLLYTPAVLTTVAGLVQCISFFFFLQPKWEKFLGFRYRLAFVILALCLGPYHEGLGTVLHSYFYMGFASTFLVFEMIYLPDESRELRPIKMLWVFIAGISGPAVLICIISPILAYSVLTAFRASRPGHALLRFWRQLSLSPILWALAASVAVQTIFSLYQKGASHSESRFQNWIALPQAIIHHLHMRSVLARLIPLNWLDMINHDREWALMSLVLSLPIIAMIFVRKNKKELFGFADTVLLSSAFALMLVFMGRPFFFNLFRKSLWNVCLLGDRYNIISGNLFLLAVVCFVAHTPLRRLKAMMLWIFVPAMVMTGFSRFFVEARVDAITPWAQIVREVEQVKIHEQAESIVRVRGVTVSIQQAGKNDSKEPTKF